jgi:hypothetical protein
MINKQKCVVSNSKTKEKRKQKPHNLLQSKHIVFKSDSNIVVF